MELGIWVFVGGVPLGFDALVDCHVHQFNKKGLLLLVKDSPDGILLFLFALGHEHHLIRVVALCDAKNGRESQKRRLPNSLELGQDHRNEVKLDDFLASLCFNRHEEVGEDPRDCLLPQPLASFGWCWLTLFFLELLDRQRLEQHGADTHFQKVFVPSLLVGQDTEGHVGFVETQFQLFVGHGSQHLVVYEGNLVGLGQIGSHVVNRLFDLFEVPDCQNESLCTWMF